MRLILLSLLLLLSCAGIGHANDSAFGGAGGTVAPLKDTQIRMASEDIVLSLAPVALTGPRYFGWVVTAAYVFENTTDRTVTIQMGFPELPCDGDSPCPPPGRFGFRGLKTSVRGKPVKHRTAQSEQGKALPKWAPKLGRVHLFDVTFAPREVVHINHSYQHPSSGGLGPFINFNVVYVTRTGALWAGPIGEATFTVRVPDGESYLHEHVLVPEEYALVSKTRPRKDRPTWEYRFKQTNWLPREDFSMMFVQEEPGQTACYLEWAKRAYSKHLGRAICGPDARDCQTAGSTKEQRAKAVAATRADIFADHATADVAACRNYVYARHGYPFKSAKLRKKYYPPDGSLRWCESEPTQEGVPNCADISGPWRERMIYPGPNRAYDPSLLTRADHRYLRMVQDEVAAREARAKATEEAPLPR